jgi:nitrite reductase (NADH) large subunit
MRIGIIGAGHAGVEAARVSAEKGASVVMFSGEQVLPYYRPRLVALAFGQVDFSAIQIKPLSWYEQSKIDLRLNTPVVAIDPEKKQVFTATGNELFDGLIIACGGIPVMPDFSRDGGELVVPLWNITHASAIRKRIQKDARLVIVGGGILGIEAALHAAEAGMDVCIVELMSRLMPIQFGSRASCALLRRLESKGIRVLLGSGISRATRKSEKVTLDLANGESCDAELCLVSIGARPEKALAVSAKLPCERGMVVNDFLKTPIDGCYAAGDVIQFNGITRCSMKESASQGKVAALNLISSIEGSTGQRYVPETVPLTFRSKDFEIYSIGETASPGAEEHLLDGSTETLIRALIVKEGVPVGVQMVGTREGFDSYAAEVKKAGKK